MCGEGFHFADFGSQQIKQRRIATVAGLRHQVIVVEIAQRLVGKPMQLILVQPDDRLRRQWFIYSVGAHNVAQPRADIEKPRLPGFRQFDL